MNNKALTSIFIIIFGLSISAQIPNGYYNSAQGLYGNNLKIALYNIIKNHTVLTYGSLWTSFQKTDVKPNGKVWDIYSYKPSGTQPYEYTFVTNQCGSYNSEGDCYNREHSWPQSWFNSSTAPTSDLFHIYPTDGKVNNDRGNYPYGKVGTVNLTTQNGGKLGNCISTGYNLTVFEPIDEFKGDLARGYFYMTTRYYSEDAGWSTSDATNKSTILPWQLNVLMQWHQQDPVSAKEIARNDSVYKIQNNRNPFIDNPSWVNAIWGQNASIVELKTFKMNVYPNPATNTLNLNLINNENFEISIYNVTGILEKQLNSNHQIINISDLKPGIYYFTGTQNQEFFKGNFIKQ